MHNFWLRTAIWIITILRPESFEDSYKRITNNVESLKDLRIKEGKYIPLNNNVKQTLSQEHEMDDILSKKEKSISLNG